MIQFDETAIHTITKLDPSLEISKATSKEDVAFSFKDENSFKNFKERNVNGIRFLILQDKRDKIIERLQSQLSDNFIVYCSEQNFGHEPDEITVLETADKYDALRFEGCNGVNYDIYTEDIIAYLQELEKKYPFVLTGAGFDFVQGNFISSLSSVEELAHSMYEFCPDIVDQGTESIEGLMEELKNSNSFYFWWD